MGSGLASWGRTVGLMVVGLALVALLVLPSVLRYGPVWVRSMALIGALAVLVMLLGLVNQAVAQLRGNER